MAENGNDAYRHYYDAAQAQLGERVTNLGRRQTDLETEMRSGFKQMETALAGFANETRSSIAALSQNLAERNKPQWQALGVALTFAAMLGGLAYLPIREATTDLKQAVAVLAEKTMTRDELEWRSARAAEDRSRQEAAIVDLRASTVSRPEWTERNRARDQEVADLSRRVDELRTDVGSVYGTRDVIRDMKEEIDRLRARLNGPP